MQVRDVLEDSSRAWWAIQKTIILIEIGMMANTNDSNTHDTKARALKV